MCSSAFVTLLIISFLHLFLFLADKEALCQVAFMPAANGTRLVTASCLFTRLTINLSPFAFELPSLYLPYVDILRDLGLQDTLSIASAKTLLLNLQRACGYQRLNPNEFRAVMGILHFICDQANTSDMSSWRSEAVVPDNDCRLVHAKSCVYIDSYGSSYIKFIDISKLRFVHQDLPEKLCIAFGIKKLSDVVIEVLKRICLLLCISSLHMILIMFVQLQTSRLLYVFEFVHLFPE